MVLQNLVRSARSAVECVERACDQIRGSERLAHVLRAVLATGNTLNCGTHRGDATAIKLDSLTKMADVKVRAPPPQPLLYFVELSSVDIMLMRGSEGNLECASLTMHSEGNAMCGLKGRALHASQCAACNAIAPQEPSTVGTDRQWVQHCRCLLAEGLRQPRALQKGRLFLACNGWRCWAGCKVS